MEPSTSEAPPSPDSESTKSSGSSVDASPPEPPVDEAIIKVAEEHKDKGN